MAVNIHNLVAAINPDYFCEDSVKDEVKELVKKKGYLKAAEKAKPKDSEFINLLEYQFTGNPHSLEGVKNPIEKHEIVYDNFGQGLESIYFWILDYIGREFIGVDKIIDNFVSSPGSTQFEESGRKLTRMQEEAGKWMGLANTVLRSVLNLIYDLKEFKLTLQPYDDLKSKEGKVKAAAMQSLKQKWMDQVDLAKRGTGSIRQMSIQYDYVTLIDAFFAIDSLEKLKDADLNDRVKRILSQRIPEFHLWVKESEKELRKRYEIEKVYLKSQVNTLKLYARWIKPYLKAAADLEQRTVRDASVVNVFNTSILELMLLAQGKFNLEEAITFGNIPKYFQGIFDNKKMIPILIVEFRFRTSPERQQQGGYGYRGRVEIVFTSYTLTQKELEILIKEMEDDDLGDLITQVTGATDDSLAQIKIDLDEFIDEKQKEKKEDKNIEEKEDINPFSALLSIFKKDKKKKKDEEEGLGKDSREERIIRGMALIKGRVDCAKIYGSFKGSLNIPGFK